ncbi:WD domain, G-beta repeat [Roseimaritima ulvae]|uniref:WD domain, G-beta repeat n=2 Tax=Roseimaritima ulvae TaxID=980254 RepID=A0A5B9R6Y2_9BACT|nr:WD domain, G-beta repeat [Roseimaritima ulvae]
MAADDHPRFLAWLDTREVLPRCTAISPDGRYAIAQTQVETLAYDLATQTEIRHWPTATSRHSFSDDSRYLLRLHADTLYVHTTDSFDTLARWRAQPKVPRPPGTYLQLNACISPDGTRVAIENHNHSFDHQEDADILIRNVQTGELIQGLNFPLARASPTSQPHIKFSFVGFSDRLLIQQQTYEPGKTYRHSVLMDIHSGKQLCDFPHDATLRSSGDGSLLVAAVRKTRAYTTDKIQFADNSELGIYDVRSGQRLRTINAAGTIRDFDIDASGTRLIASLQSADALQPQANPNTLPDHNARLTRLLEWDIPSGERIRELTSPPLPIAQIRYGVDAGRCILGMERPDGVDEDLELVVEVRDVTTGGVLSKTDWLPRGTLADLHSRLYLFPDGQRMMILRSRLQIQTFPEGQSVWNAVAKRHPVRQAEFSPSGKYCWTDHFLTDLSTGHQRQWLDCDGLKFILGGDAIFDWRYNQVGILTTASNQRKWQQGFQWNGRILHADISPDTRRIAVLLERDRYSTNNEPRPRQLVLLDRDNQDQPRAIPIHARRLAFHPSGDTLFVAGDEAVERIDFATGKSVGTPVPLSGETLAIECGPQGKRLLVAGQSPTDPDGYRNLMGSGWLACFDLSDNAAIGFHRSETPITALAISADGKTLAAANLASDSVASQIWVWDAGSMQRQFVIDGHRLSIHDLAFSPDGQTLLSAADDGAVLWDMRADAAVEQAAADSDKLVFPHQLKPIELANAYTGEIRKIKPYDGPLLVPAEDTPPSLRREKADWPLIKIHQARELEVTDPLFGWIRSANTRYHVSEKIDWSSAESQWLRSYDFGTRSEDWQYRLAYEQSGRNVVLLDAQGKIVQRFSRAAGIAQAALSPSAQRVAIVPLDRVDRALNDRRLQVELYDAISGEKKLTTAPTEGIHVSLLELERQDRFVHVNDNRRAVLMLDAHSGDTLARYAPKHAMRVLSRMAPSGRFVATSEIYGDGVVLRDPSTLQEIKRLPARFTVSWMRWTPNSNRLMVGQSFGESMELVECFDADSGRSLWTRRMPSTRDVVFDQAGEWMLTEAQVGSHLDVLCRVSDGAITAVFMTTGSSDLERPCLSRSGGTVYLGSPAGPTLWPRTGPALRAEVRRRDSAVEFLKENDTTVIDIVSEFGIAGASIQRTSPQWPKSMLVRLHLRGLEQFRVDSGAIAVDWSVSSGGERNQSVSLRSGPTETILDANSPYHTVVRIVGGKGTIPLHDGYFEVPLPAKLFETNPDQIQLKWVDFYRN